MKPRGEFLSSFEKSWGEFSTAWKRADAKASEKSIHGLRVSTRRLIATLELARAMSRNREIPKLQRRFKKVFKSLGPLRDVQVQLKKIAEVRQAGAIIDFRETLKRRERRLIARVARKLKQDLKRRLHSGVKEVRSEFARLYEKSRDERIQNAVSRILRLRRSEFLKIRKQFDPADEETLHQMRIALKKLRYTVEAALPLVGDSAKERSDRMREFQQLLGDTRDLDLLRARLEKWAAKRGKNIAIVPALESFKERRENLMNQIVEAAGDFENIFPEEHPKPAVEKTLVVEPEAITTTGVNPSPRARSATAR